ncbi:hypothetical protein ACHHYP_11615 [Achlya hypogyna]|uniref:Transmembrane protein n=1 Tax=Achlya hypogyna TaxID=1202772 RepID=A0A1V9YIU9_ACHHY|nr:hypothetical protein ACHHYP_11615 [Achlya hypogyna]
MKRSKPAVAVVLSALSLGGIFASALYPAWCSQTYAAHDVRVFQGFSLFGFYSRVSGARQITTPFLASNTYISYSDLCSADFEAPNWMFGSQHDYQSKLCGITWTLTQVLLIMTLALNIIALTFNLRTLHTPELTIAENVAGLTTIANGFLQVCVVMLWGLQLQPSLLDIGIVAQNVAVCTVAGMDGWTCWGFGPSFFVAGASILFTLVTFSFVSSGRRRKMRQRRKAALAALLEQPTSHHRQPTRTLSIVSEHL